MLNVNITIEFLKTHLSHYIKNKNTKNERMQHICFKKKEEKKWTEILPHFWYYHPQQQK